MPASNSTQNRSRKEIMNKNSFLTYKQGLTLTVPGSQAVGVSSWWISILRFANTTRRAVYGTATQIELTLRDIVLANFIFALYIAYTTIPKAAAAAVVYARTISLNAILKRSLDIVGASFGLALMSPVFLLTAIAIKLDSPGPVFFKQLRVGMDRRRNGRRSAGNRTLVDRRARERRRENTYGRPFMVYKFRSMVDNAEKKSGPIWASENDPRITRVGMFLRKTRLDEFPQLINVLKGEMSLVGPRPERPVFVAKLSNDVTDYTKRLTVKPGITGLAQVRNGYDTSVSSVRRKVMYDLHYIKKRSIWQDIKILLQTVVVVITGKGAF